MQRTVASLLLTILVTFAASAPAATPPTSEPARIAAPAAASCIPADRCCRICDTGQACGNSCIAASKTCHKGRGCACNAAEVCAS